MKRHSEHIGNFSGIENLMVMRHAHNYNRFLKETVASRVPTYGGTVVDFGAGTGEFASFMRERVDDMWCVETDASLQSSIRRKGMVVYSRLDAIAPACVDFVYSLNVLEHIEDDVASLKAMNSVLRPGGGLCLYVPAFKVLYSSMDRQVGHIRRYSGAELRRKLSDAGFSIVSFEYVDSLGFPASWVLKYFGRTDGQLGVDAVSFYDRLVFPLSRVIDRFTKRLIGKNALVYAVKQRCCAP